MDTIPSNNEAAKLAGPAESYIAGNGATYVKKLASCAPEVLARRIRNGLYRMEAGQLHKRCSKCMDYWPADTEFFYSTKSKQDGLYDWCKACYQQWRYPSGRKREARA